MGGRGVAGEKELAAHDSVGDGRGGRIGGLPRAQALVKEEEPLVRGLDARLGEFRVSGEKKRRKSIFSSTSKYFEYRT